MGLLQRLGNKVRAFGKGVLGHKKKLGVLAGGVPGLKAFLSPSYEPLIKPVDVSPPAEPIRDQDLDQFTIVK
jgi:hypothetical protein